MKVMRIAAVLSMFAASSALGAITLEVTPADATPNASGLVTLTFSLDHQGDTTAIGGFSIFTQSNKPGKAMIPAWVAPEPASRRVLAPWLVSGDFGVGNSSSLIGNKPVEGISDLGAVTADVSSLNDGGVSGPLFSLDLKVNPDDLPLTLTFSGGLTTAGFEDLAIPSRIVNIVPEPASMILLAIGGAFFARRRRVA